MKLSAAITLAAVSGAQAFTAPVNKPLRPASSLSVSQSDLDGAQSMIEGILKEKNCGPVFVRLAWHDSGTYDVSIPDSEWPKAGGAIGSIRFEPEINHGANAGLA